MTKASANLGALPPGLERAMQAIKVMISQHYPDGDRKDAALSALDKALCDGEIDEFNLWLQQEKESRRQAV